MIGYINEENFEKVLTMCGNNPNYEVAIEVCNIRECEVFINEIASAHHRQPIPYLEHIEYEHPWMCIYPIGKLTFSNGSYIDIIAPRYLKEHGKRYHTILVGHHVPEESYIEYNLRFTKGYERMFMPNPKEEYYATYRPAPTTIFGRYVLGEWSGTEAAIATIVDEENNTDALDDFLNEFKIVSKK